MESDSDNDCHSMCNLIKCLNGDSVVDETRKMVSMRELLESGVLTDVKVSCGDRTWDLHKLILCSRSSFFKNALTGEFEVRSTSKAASQRTVCSRATVLTDIIPGSQDRPRYSSRERPR